MLKIELIKCPIHNQTFKIKPIRLWVEKHSFGKCLNLFAGTTILDIDETRIDLNPETNPDYVGDALDYLNLYNDIFDTVILDPPYSYRKSMEYYNGHKNSRFKLVKDALVGRCQRVITFGYQAISMGKNRGFEPIAIAIFSHGGATHDTIATVEELNEKI